MWFNKNHPNAIYGDIRTEKKGFSKNKSFKINPDIELDFRELPFKDNSFKLVVFDPPHIRGKLTNMELKKLYGVLSPLTWRRDLKQGFDECWRVLEKYGVLIFKWNELSISYKEILKVLGKEPLFHQKSGNSSHLTYWACFMKLPEEYNTQEILEQ
jgi:hypothetical protein